MADRNQLKVRHESEFEETDPLAELTRIMGFDPRREPTPPLDDDLGIDLERELLGEFGSAGDDQPAQPPVEGYVQGTPAGQSTPRTEAYAPDAAVDSFDTTFEEIFAADPVREVETADLVKKETPILEPSDVAAVDEDAVEEFDAAFEKAIAAGIDDDWPMADDFTGEVGDPAADDVAGEQEIVGEGEVDIDFTGQLSPADDPDDESVVHETDDLELDIDFTGQLSPVDGQEFDDVDSTLTEAVEGELSFEDELAALLGSSHHVEVPTETTVSGKERFGVAYEASTDLDSAYEASSHVDVSYEAPTDIDEYEAALQSDLASWENDLTATPELDDEAQPHFEPAAGGEGQDDTAASVEAFVEPEAADAIEDDFEFDFDIGPEAEYQHATDIADEGVAQASDDRVVEDASAETVRFYEEAGGADAATTDPEELVLDDGEFEAALADELSASQPAEPAYESETSVGEPQQVSSDADDPFATLATMGLVAPTRQEWQHTAPVQTAHGVAEDYASEADRSDIAPEIETVDVPEATVAVADDLDIPEVAFEEEAPRPVAFDDFEAEFAQAFDEPAPTHTGAANGPTPQAMSKTDEFDADFDQIFQRENWDEHAGHVSGAAAAAAIGAGASATAAGAATPPHNGPRANSGDDYESDFFQNPDEQALGYDPAADGDLPIPHAAEGASPSRKRGFAVAAVVAGVALVGGIGAFAYSLGGGNDAPPVLVKAEPGPVKIKPENPGGVVVPNQDNKVYERVAGAPVEPPSQEKLISGEEEPVELQAVSTQPLVTDPVPELKPAAESGSDPIQALAESEATAPAAISQEPEAGADPEVAQTLPGVDLAVPEAESLPSNTAPSAKGEDRIDPTEVAADNADNEQIAAVAPRKVRTMIVRPDGTLVPRENPPASATADAAAPAAPAEPAFDKPALAPLPATEPTGSGNSVASSQTAPVAPDAVATEKPASAEANGSPQPAAGTPSTQVAAAPAPESSASEPALPAQAPVVPSRPADQPVDIVGEVKTRTQVAAAEPAAAAAAAATSGWSMQIASQPSPEGAQATYEDLARRYGEVLGGRGVNIVKAEIAGKGTFWRVRVPVESRDEAIQLCNRYKAAGGSCFVSQ